MAYQIRYVPTGTALQANVSNPNLSVTMGPTFGSVGPITASGQSPNPSPITDLTITGVTTTTLSISYHRPDDGLGNGAKALVRISSSTAFLSDWNTYETQHVLAGNGVGSLVTDTFTNLTPATTYYVRAEAFRGIWPDTVYSTTSDAVSDTTDASGGGASFGANEPAGLTTITDRSFHAASEGSWWEYSFSTAFAYVTGQGGPEGDNLVQQTTFPAGIVDSNDFVPPITGVTLEGQGYTRIYLAVYHRVSSNWEGHYTNSNKAWRFGETGGPGSGFFRPNLKDLGGSSYEIEAFKVGSGDVNSETLTRNGTQVVLTKGNWTLWELDVQLESSLGASDGVLKMWIDGTLTHSYSNLRYIPTNTSAIREFGEVKFDPVWGGTGGTATSEAFYQYNDHVYISGS